MKIYNTTNKEQLHSELVSYLEKFRKSRNFNSREYLPLKALLLNNYMTNHKLKSVVVAVSGGIDSAVVLGIVNYAKQLKGSPIEKIIPVSLPVENTNGAVGQKAARDRARELCQKWNLPLYVIELKEPFHSLVDIVDNEIGVNGGSWACGQLVSYLRTPTLYYINSLMSQEGLGCVIAGTTNKSEGSYLGYVGKASDGMVDLQIISDIYKSEVYKVGAELGVVESIMSIAPTGDMFDGRNDEEVFGASYDFVELYLEVLSGKTIELKEKEAIEQFSKYKDSLDKMHAYNKHKYLVGSPAIHLDLITNRIYPYWGQPFNQEHIDYNKIVNIQSLSKVEMDNSVEIASVVEKQIVNNKDPIVKINKLLTKDEVKMILLDIEDKNWVSAGKTGYVVDDSKGSMRLSNINQKMADEITRRLIPYIQNNIIQNNVVYRFVGVANLFRYIKYPKNGLLYPHRDLSFSFNNKRKTMKSLVIYLTNGQTTFLKEKEGGDWNRSSVVSERLDSIGLDIGDAIIFDHDLLHESLIHDEEKIIIRTDLIYEVC